jgi:hypothetical protein
MLSHLPCIESENISTWWKPIKQRGVLLFTDVVSSAIATCFCFFFPLAVAFCFEESIFLPAGNE